MSLLLSEHSSLQRVQLLDVASVGAAARSVFGLCVSVYEVAYCVSVWFVREPVTSKTKEASASQRETHAGRQYRAVAHERSASNNPPREMVTSTPGILLLPMLICLPHHIIVRGKSRISRVCVFFYFSFFVYTVCVLELASLRNTHCVG